MSVKVLILGGTGMLGHKAWQTFRSSCDTYITVRRPFSYYKHYDLFVQERTLDNVDATCFQSVQEIVDRVKPQVILNCVGIIKQSPASNEFLKSIEINALFPHRLAEICNRSGVRLIHISTDCVFSGKKGQYIEEDSSDAEDLYGRTKFLGEVVSAKALTLRTSIIGRELNSQHSLLEWFLSQKKGEVKGYTKAVFSGFTTKALCDIILNVIKEHKELSGLYHVSSEPIDKFSLLSLIKEIYKLDIEIEPYDKFVCDCSLDSTRFRKATNFKPFSWREMITNMYSDSAFYDQLGRKK